jgi:hypothetical protein
MNEGLKISDLPLTPRDPFREARNTDGVLPTFSSPPSGPATALSTAFIPRAIP